MDSNRNVSAAAAAEVIAAAGTRKVYGAFWAGGRLLVYGRDGYDQYQATRDRVGELVAWATARGWQVDEMAASRPTGHTWVLALVPRELMLDGATPWDGARRDAAAEAVEAQLDHLIGKYDPIRRAEDVRMYGRSRQPDPAAAGSN